MTEQQAKSKKPPSLYSFAEFPEAWGITLVVYKNGKNHKHYLCDTQKQADKIKAEYRRMS